MPAANCSNCGARLAKDTRFCPECGVRTAAASDSTAIEEVPPDETGQVPVHKVAAAPRYFGVAPPLALFTLDSGSWETRGHTIAEPDVVPEPVTDFASSPHVLAHAQAVTAARTRATTGQAQLPAA